MVKNTKQVLGDTLKELLKEKPIDRVTVKELVEKCGYNRQTFYYHFYGVDDLLAWVFEQDANKALPETINSDTVADGWRECVVIYFKYLKDNASTVLNVYQSGKRSYMIDYFRTRLKGVIQQFANLATADMNVSWEDMEFVVDFYTQTVTGLIVMWMENNLVLPPLYTEERCLKALDGTIERLTERIVELSDNNKK